MIALVQEGVDREPAQQRFVERVRGRWEAGRFAPAFTNGGDVGFAVVRALNAWRSAAPSAERVGAAVSRARDLARGTERPGTASSGSKLRIVAVPLMTRPLLDALALSNADGLIEDLARAARSTRLVSQAMGIDGRVDSSDCIVLRVSPQQGWEQPVLMVASDGAVVAEGAVAGTGQFFGGSVLMHDRVVEVIERSLRFAEAVWEHIDSRDEVQQVVVVAAVPNAAQKVYALTEPRNHMSLPSVGGLPDLVIIPQDPQPIRRQDLSDQRTRDRLRAEIQRRFQAASAVHTG